tara:strand:+ start:453 stop:1094 length:642 start_codon:yes stop_codon:yes gene_type:complete
MIKKILLLILLFISCSTQTDVNVNSSEEIETIVDEGVNMKDSKVYKSVPEMNIDTTKNYTAVLNTSLGNITIEFFTTDAPLTVNNFINLAKDGYYDDVIFHRVISGFMIQGGDPSGTGHGDMGKYPGYQFEDELNNQIPYEKGIVAMANAGPNTNGSQFFIMHVDYPLPYQYTIFGKVTDGIDVVDKIASVETSQGDRPVSDIIINSIEIKEN